MYFWIECRIEEARKETSKELSELSPSDVPKINEMPELSEAKSVSLFKISICSFVDWNLPTPTILEIAFSSYIYIF